jgi:hypothetical protein
MWTLKFYRGYQQTHCSEAVEKHIFEASMPLKMTFLELNLNVVLIPGMLSSTNNAESVVMHPSGNLSLAFKIWKSWCRSANSFGTFNMCLLLVVGKSVAQKRLRKV